MEILIRGEKIDVTKSIKDYVFDKLKKLDKYFEEPDNIKCNVLVKVKENTQIIEVTIPTKKFTLRAEEKQKDLYSAIDLVVDKLEKQIRKNKSRLNDKLKKEDKRDFVFDFSVEEENNNSIVKRKTIDAKPMDEEEAILQMELLDHDFFVFKNIKEDCYSILYKRKDANYGIINTK